VRGERDCVWDVETLNARNVDEVAEGDTCCFAREEPRGVRVGCRMRIVIARANCRLPGEGVDAVREQQRANGVRSCRRRWKNNSPRVNL
jgi:hypothetical protein